MSSPLALTRRPLLDQVTDIQARNNGYAIEDFKAGGCRLNTVELEGLGDVSGKTLLHLQCHIGLDTLSWARRGAIVTGVDFSPKAISVARALASEVGIEARFLEADVYDLPGQLPELFDIVFMSYGGVSWLADLKAWSSAVARFVKPEGIFYLIEDHPLTRVFPAEPDSEYGAPGGWPRFPHFYDSAGTLWSSNRDETEVPAWPPRKADGRYGIGEIVNALVESGLQIERTSDHIFSPSPTDVFQPRLQADYGR